MTQRPRAIDVARRAKVSQTAVSLVLNGQAMGVVSESSQERILQAVLDLNYQPNRMAQSLRLQKSHALGLVTDSVASSPFAGQILAGATATAGAHGYVVLAYDSHNHPEREHEAVEELQRRQVDGLIYATMGYCELLSGPTASVPVVMANCTTGNSDETSVSPDDAGGARVATQHLIGLGHRRIAMISGPWDPEKSSSPGNISGPIRKEAFLAACFGAGVDEADISVLVASEWEIDDGYRAAITLLGGAIRPTAIFAVNDRVATGVLLAAAKLGIEVPTQLSVIGFDDQQSLAAHVVPALTTVALPHREMGERAVELLLQRLADPSIRSRHEVLECPLVERHSTAPPP